MKKINYRTLISVAVLFSFYAANAHSALRVFACEPEWASLTKEIGGKYIKVKSATRPLQDPHHIQARPSLIARMRRAKLIVCTGAGLEQGWLPIVIRHSANPDVRPGKSGNFMASNFINLLDVPKTLDRSHGHVHVDGNPHLHSNPHNILKVARALANRLKTIDPANQQHYESNFIVFQTRWLKAIKRWEKQAKPLRNKQVITQHRTWLYFARWLRLDVVTTIEDKPGVPASIKRLNQVAKIARARKAKLIIHADSLDPKPAKWLAKITGIKRVELPYTVGGSSATRTLEGYFDTLLNKMLQ